MWFAQAHRCGLGYALEAKAIAARAGDARAGPAGAYLTFNLSPSSLLSDEVHARAARAPRRASSSRSPRTSSSPATRRIPDALADLRARGARLAVDDTGAGYAGLTHVMRLQPDIIKLDRALTTGVDLDPAKAPLISSFVRYARDIDADVCAEGVETLAELERLADLDVAYGQGYGIARPAAPWAAGRARGGRRLPALLPGDAGRLRTARRQPTTTAGSSCSARRLAATTTRTSSRPAWRRSPSELQADEVRLVGPDADAPATQLLADDPDADPGAAAALRAPASAPASRCRSPTAASLVGHLEAYARKQRPWSRFQIGRARRHLLPARLAAPRAGHFRALIGTVS